MKKILENILYAILIGAFLVSGVMILIKTLPTCWLWYLILVLSSSIIFFIEIKSCPEEENEEDIE